MSIIEDISKKDVRFFFLVCICIKMIFIMKKNDNKQMVLKYSVEMLYNDIVRQYQMELDNGGNVGRDVQYYLKVFNYIVFLVQEVERDKDSENYRVIKNKLDDDSLLLVYSFFVSSQSKFDYSWSYLRKQWDEFVKMLNGACKFILDMIDKVNSLNEYHTKFVANEFVFADLFVLSYLEDGRVPRMKIVWEKMNCLLHMGKAYLITAKVGVITLMAMNLEIGKQDDMDSFLNNLVGWDKKK